MATFYIKAERVYFSWEDNAKSKREITSVKYPLVIWSPPGDQTPEVSFKKTQ